MKERIRRIIAVAVATMLFAVFVIAPADTYAASKTKKMTAYTCIKTGNTVYCTGFRDIYKVNLNTGSVKVLNKPRNYCTAMKLKGKYLYCAGNKESGDSGVLFRINLKTNKYKVLAKKTRTKNGGNGFVISGSKIYYSTVKFTDNGDKYTNRVMGLNGKSKKKTKTKFTMKVKSTNNNNYAVRADYKDDNYVECDYYLSTPSGDIFLGTESY